MRGAFFVAALALTGLVSLHVVQAQVMSSGNYQIQSDSVNFGGGFSTSTNYELESTAGEIATGPSDSTNYQLRAGYQQMQSVYLALSGGANVTMTPSIPGVSGGTANGSTTITAITDSPSGYQLTIESSANPSMNSGANTIADYVPTGAPPDRIFALNSTDAHLAYSPFGDHIVDRFKDDGSDCDAGTNNTAEECWDGLSLTAETIAESSSPNQPTGTDTTIYYRVGVGSSVLQPPGSYVATTTVTLLAL